MQTMVVNRYPFYRMIEIILLLIGTTAAAADTPTLSALPQLHDLNAATASLQYQGANLQRDSSSTILVGVMFLVTGLAVAMALLPSKSSPEASSTANSLAARLLVYALSEPNLSVTSLKSVEGKTSDRVSFSLDSQLDLCSLVDGMTHRRSSLDNSLAAATLEPPAIDKSSSQRCTRSQRRCDVREMLSRRSRFCDMHTSKARHPGVKPDIHSSHKLVESEASSHERSGNFGLKPDIHSRKHERLGGNGLKPDIHSCKHVRDGEASNHERVENSEPHTNQRHQIDNDCLNFEEVSVASGGEGTGHQSHQPGLKPDIQHSKPHIAGFGRSQWDDWEDDWEDIPRARAPITGLPMDGDDVGICPRRLKLPKAMMPRAQVGIYGRSMFQSDFSIPKAKHTQ